MLSSDQLQKLRDKLTDLVELTNEIGFDHEAWADRTIVELINLSAVRHHAIVIEKIRARSKEGA